MKFSDGIFLTVAREVAREYPDIGFEDVVIDALCMRLVRNPQQYDVIVLPNLYGDIVSDLCAGLVGGLGVAPGANVGDKVAIFEPTHGSAPRYVGQNKVNPMAMMLSATMMLRHIGEAKTADKLEKAIAGVIAEGKKVTYDLKADRNQPAATTSEVADAVLEKLKK
jgi:isocitrate dehydrogenase (NAD+)